MFLKMYFKTTANFLLGTVGTVDPFPVTSSNVKMTFSFVIVSNIVFTTLKFENKVGAKLNLNKLLNRFFD